MEQVKNTYLKKFFDKLLKQKEEICVERRI